MQASSNLSRISLFQIKKDKINDLYSRHWTETKKCSSTFGCKIAVLFLVWVLQLCLMWHWFLGECSQSIFNTRQSCFLKSPVPDNSKWQSGSYFQNLCCCVFYHISVYVLRFDYCFGIWVGHFCMPLLHLVRNWPVPSTFLLFDLYLNNRLFIRCWKDIIHVLQAVSVWYWTVQCSGASFNAASREQS